MASCPRIQSRLFTTRAGVAVEVDEARNLAADVLRPPRHRVVVVQRAFFVTPGRIANQSRGAAHQGDGPVPRKLVAPEHHQRHQIPHLQARRARIEPAIQRPPALPEVPVKPITIRNLRNKAPRLERTNQRAHRPASGKQKGANGTPTLHARTMGLLFVGDGLVSFRARRCDGLGTGQARPLRALAPQQRRREKPAFCASAPRRPRRAGQPRWRALGLMESGTVKRSRKGWGTFWHWRSRSWIRTGTWSGALLCQWYLP